MESFSDYESIFAFRADYKFRSIVPIKHAALELDLTQTTIKSKIRQGVLKGLKIDRDYFVFGDALQKAIEKEKASHDLTISFLLENLEKGETHLDYSTGMERIGLRHHISSDRTKYAKILGRISEATDTICDCLITVIVHSKDKDIPSNGFFGLAEGLDYEWDDEKDFTKKQTKRVLKKLDKIKRLLPGVMEELFGL